MKFSLVLSTVERTTEVDRFLKSISDQGIHLQSVELIVVDQNDDDRLVPILARYADRVAIIHVRSERGLSRARNTGLKYVSGDIVAFPDDDCWYPAGILDRVSRFFQANMNVDGVTGRFTDHNGFSEGRWLARSCSLNRFNVWRGAISFSIFLRGAVVDRVGRFNESLGVGAGTPWGAAEETDYLLRGIAHGFELRFLHDLILGHPVKAARFDAKARERQHRYEAGIGRVIRINRYPFWYFPITCLRTACGILLALVVGNLGRATFKLAALRGRLNGWRGVTVT